MRKFHLVKLVLLLSMAPAASEGQLTELKCEQSDWRSGQRIDVKKHSLSDGDTLKVIYKKGRKQYLLKVRLLGIDTPETHFQGKSQGKWGEEAKNRFEALVDEKGKLSIEFDRVACGKFKRFLGYVIKNDKDINLQLLKEGLAVNFCVYPTIGRCPQYAAAVKMAMEEKKGMWSEDEVELPYDFRSRISRSDDAEFVTRIGGKVHSFKDREDIPVAQRLFFIERENVTYPFSPPENKDNRP